MAIASMRHERLCVTYPSQGRINDTQTGTGQPRSPTQLPRASGGLPFRRQARILSRFPGARLCPESKVDRGMLTYSPKASEITRAWHVIDAEGLVLGRMCTEAARVLRGKHKPIFAPHIDTGDHVIIINASKIVLTDDKADQEGRVPLQRLPRRPEDRVVRQAARPQARRGNPPQRSGACCRRARSAAR